MSIFKNKIYFSKYTLVYLIYNIYTVLGGAYVRATGSGAGCGKHWPLCNGFFIPNFTHRISSAFVTLGGILLVTWSFSCFPKRNYLRKSSLAVLFFIFLEAFLGALLVLLGLVAKDTSTLRAIFMPLHLVTTFLLLASLVLTYAWSKNYPTFTNIISKPFKKSIFTLLFLLIISSTGSITALSDTLFKPKFAGENLFQELFFSENTLKFLRSFHPILAILVSFVFIKTLVSIKEYSQKNLQQYHQNENYKLYFKIISVILILQIITGFLNIFLLIPVWTQIIHLLLADLLWIYSILFINSLLFMANENTKQD